MRGSSGAKLTNSDNYVTKQDTAVTGRRVRDQGIWLYQHDESVTLPFISFIRHDGYDMEKLTMCEIPTTWKETSTLCDEIMEALSSHLWELEFTASPAVELVQLDVWNHRGYITELLDDVGMRRELRRKLHSFTKKIDWWDLSVARTHGDAIIDNLAYRTNNGVVQAVLIDPIPACSALPDLAALDVGRVIQSAAGYEVVRYDVKSELLDLSLHERVDTLLNTWLNGDFSVNEVRAALHFSVIHTLRGVRSAQRAARDRVDALKSLTYDLLEVADQWMQ